MNSNQNTTVLVSHNRVVTTQYSLKVYRETMRGWHVEPSHAFIWGLGKPTRVSLTQTVKGWCAKVEVDGVEYRAEGRRQIDAARDVADQIVANITA